MTTRFQLRRGERGNAMIEFALSALVLTLMFIITFQFGYAFYVYNKLQTAVRNGARYASVRNFNAGNASSRTKFQTAVQQMVVYGDPALSSGTPVVPGLATGALTVSITDANGTAASSTVMPDRVQVQVTGYNLDALFRTYSLTTKPVEAFPYVGLYLPTGTE